MEILPLDAFYLIVSLIPPRNIIYLRLINKRWKQLIDKEEFWKGLASSYKIPKPINRSFCWHVISQQSFNGKTGVGTIGDYHGEISNGKCTGYGTSIINDAAFYGNFHDGKRDGFFRFQAFDDSIKGTGFFHNDTVTGILNEIIKDTICEFHYQNGRVKSGKIHNSNGCYYEGELKDVKVVKPHGYGKYTWKNGVQYVGQFNLGARQGNGMIILPDNTEYPGIWDKDKRINGSKIIYDGKFY